MPPQAVPPPPPPITEAEWAYLRPYYSNRERLDTLHRFLAYYNHRRPHGGIGGATPTSRL